MRSPVVSLLIACALVLSALPAQAMDRNQAAESAKRATGGRVLAVEESTRNGEPVFLVRVLTPSGEVRVVVIEAGNGRKR